MVFPTHVGVFPHRENQRGKDLRLPHARGGVSTWQKYRVPCGQSSPRTWGCFYTPASSIATGDVFPTHVGVFPSNIRMASGVMRLPHARGGVSVQLERPRSFIRSSPRTWGCFQVTEECSEVPAVFPTHVGCFASPGTLSARWSVSTTRSKLRSWIK